MCGIAGAFDVPDAADVVSRMLVALQHRGQDAAGIAAWDGERFDSIRDLGLVQQVFGGIHMSKRLPGRHAVGHVRYATSGSAREKRNVQPVIRNCGALGTVAIAHNGHLTNADAVRERLAAAGARFETSTDTEVIPALMAESASLGLGQALAAAFEAVRGAFAVVILVDGQAVAATDPFGFRPLAFAKHKGGWVVASETHAFDVLDVRGGAMPAGTAMVFSSRSASVLQYDPGRPFHRNCGFEQVYFSRPDSVTFGVSSHTVRERLGFLLGRKDTTLADLVTPVPDSSNAMAAAYARERGMPFVPALIRSHYTDRSFIKSDQKEREKCVRLKLGAVRSAVGGKRIVVVDDSLVRGNTMRRVVALCRSVGAREVHVRIASPPIIHPCRWGIALPTFEELAMHGKETAAEMRQELGADSLTYLSIEELLEALDDRNQFRHCITCFSGRDPMEESLCSVTMRQAP